MNRQDLEEAARFVDPARYRENCVGFTRGFVDWEEAQKSVRQVWKGLPNLRVELDQVLASGDVALAGGRIIERVQQADVLAQMRQLYGKPLGLAGLDAMFLWL